MITKMISFSKSGGCAATRTAAGRQEYLERDDRAIYIETNNIFDEKNWGQEIDRSRDDYGDRGTVTGREYIMSPPDHDYCTPERMLDVARDWVEERHPDVESVIAVHNDNGHVHCHIYMGAYNLETQRKEHFSHEDIRTDHNRAQDIARDHGLSRGPDYERGRDFRNETDRNYSRAVEEMRARGDATPMRDAAEKRAQERALEQQRARALERSQEQARSHEKERAQEPERKTPEPQRKQEPQRVSEPQRESVIEKTPEPVRQEQLDERANERTHQEEPERSRVSYEEPKEKEEQREPDRDEDRYADLTGRTYEAAILAEAYLRNERELEKDIEREARARDEYRESECRFNTSVKELNSAVLGRGLIDRSEQELQKARNDVYKIEQERDDIGSRTFFNRKDFDRTEEKLREARERLERAERDRASRGMRSAADAKVTRARNERNDARSDRDQKQERLQQATDRKLEHGEKRGHIRPLFQDRYAQLSRGEREQLKEHVGAERLSYCGVDPVKDRGLVHEKEHEHEIER